MKRKVFATAVVLVVLATPLFGAQAATSAKPAQDVAAKQPAASKPVTAKPDEKKQPPTKAAPAPPKLTSVTVNKPAAQKPSTAPAAKGVPTVATKTAPAAATKAAPAAATKAAPAAATKAAPVAATKAVPAVATKTASSVSVKSVPVAAKSSPAGVKAGHVELSPVQEKLQANKDLSRDVQDKLRGADVVSAAAGFKDLPQFVSTAYASHNLGISFEALKTKLLNGKHTGLRQAIQELRPAASAAIEAQRAQYDAVSTIRATEKAAAEAAAAAKPVKPTPATATPVKAVPKPKSSASGQN